MQVLTTYEAPELVSQLAAIAADETPDLKEAGTILDHNDDFGRRLVEAARSHVFDLDQTVRSPREALEALGIETTLQLALCFALFELAPGDSHYPIGRFFDNSLRRAVAARLTAPIVGLESTFEMFAMGFCQDVGVLLLLDQESHLAEDLGKLSLRPNWIRREAERSYGTTHDEHTANLLKSWGLPDSFTKPVEFHHESMEAPVEYQKKALALYLADLLADLVVVREKRDVRFALEEQLANFNCEPGTVKNLVDQMSEAYRDAANLLELSVPAQIPTEILIAVSSATAVPANLSYQELSDELAKSLRQQQQLYTEIQQITAELSQQSRIDRLTGLPSRRWFDDSIESEMARARRIETPTSILMADIDNLASINTEHGYLAGDNVLKEVASVLLKTVRTEDIPCRYCDDTFAVILPHTDQQGAEITAERFREAVEQARAEIAGLFLNVTVSVGVATLEEPTGRRPGIMLIRSADDALFEAKEKGGNASFHASSSQRSRRG